MDFKNYCAAVEKHEDAMRVVADFMWTHPETGYREWQATDFLAKIFEDAGYEVHRAGDIPGFYTDIDTGREGPKVLILAELDALITPNHFAACNGRAHACGHHMQCAALTGLALALKEPHMLDDLCGSIRLMAVPAEEGIEIEFRDELRQKGTLRYFCGKDEFLYRGYMKDVDLAFMFHTGTNQKYKFDCHYGSNGLIIKKVDFAGVAAHAGGSPHLGVNALYAATTGLQAINALRETFQEKDTVRIHPILTDGGGSVNIIPAHAGIASYVRGGNVEAIADANRKVNRALAGAALSIGCTVHVKDYASYAPLINDDGMATVLRDVMENLLGAENCDFNHSWGCGSTDMGNLSCVMPVVHPHISGAVGKGHGDDYKIADFHNAGICSAQAQLLFAVELLKDNAARAKRVLADFKPRYADVSSYFAAMDALYIDRELVSYDGDSAKVVF